MLLVFGPRSIWMPYVRGCSSGDRDKGVTPTTIFIVGGGWAVTVAIVGSLDPGRGG